MRTASWVHCLVCALLAPVVSQIIVLILSQDTSFSHNIHKVHLTGAVPWYKERMLNKISLGSMVYVVLLRWVHTSGSCSKLACLLLILSCSTVRLEYGLELCCCSDNERGHAVPGCIWLSEWTAAA